MWKMLKAWYASYMIAKLIRTGMVFFDHVSCRIPNGEDGEVTVLCFYSNEDEFRKYIRDES
jgi:hypothetical protein